MKRPPRSAPVTLGLIQTACSADPADNVRRTLAAADRAARDGAHIICTQELFRSHYFCQSEDYAQFDLAEPIPGPTTAAFQRLARRRRVVVIASLRGLEAKGGPKGVGDAVNQSVVITFLLLFLANLIITAVYLQIVPAKGS